MGQIVTQGLPAELIASLTNDSDGTPATGLTFSSVQVSYRRAGDVSLTTKTMTSDNFVEIGQGFYKIVFTGTELDLPGPFIFVVYSVGIQTFQGEAQVRSTASTIPNVPLALPTCDLYGNVLSLDGEPVVGAAIAARVLGMPTIEGLVALTDDILSATTDNTGTFVLTVVRLATVEVTIPLTNYRRQLIVPNTPSANLFLVP